MLDPRTADQQSLRLEFRYRSRGRPAEKRPPVPFCPAELADLLDPPPDRRCQLKFVVPRGSPMKLNQYWHEHQIYIQVRFARARRGKTYTAVEDEVQPETRLSRATIYRAWRANKLKTD